MPSFGKLPFAGNIPFPRLGDLWRALGFYSHFQMQIVPRYIANGIFHKQFGRETQLFLT